MIILHKRDLVGHFAELEYTWGTPLLAENQNTNNSIIPLISYTRYESNTTINQNLTYSYTYEQIQFSKELIERWSNFMKYGRPTSRLFKEEWPPISNLSTAYIMHLQINQSEINKLIIPSEVLFWKNQCPSKTNQNITKIAQKKKSCIDLSYIIDNIDLFFINQ